MSMGKHKDILILQLLSLLATFVFTVSPGLAPLRIFNSDGRGVVVFASSVKLERMLRIRKDSIN